MGALHITKVHKNMEICFHTHGDRGLQRGKVWERCTMGKADAACCPTNLSSTLARLPHIASSTG